MKFVAHFFYRLAQSWPTIPYVAMATFLWKLLESVLDLYAELLATDGGLVLLALTMLWLDWITGTAKALYAWCQSGNTFSLEKQRQSLLKFIMWVFVVAICVMLANGFARVGWPWLDSIFVLDSFALMLCAWIEGLSAASNVGGDRVMEKIRRLVREREAFFLGQESTDGALEEDEQ